MPETSAALCRPLWSGPFSLTTLRESVFCSYVRPVRFQVMTALSLTNPLLRILISLIMRGRKISCPSCHLSTVGFDLYSFPMTTITHGIEVLNSFVILEWYGMWCVHFRYFQFTIDKERGQSSLSPSSTQVLHHQQKKNKETRKF
jgi:hypothetical protein